MSTMSEMNPNVQIPPCPTCNGRLSGLRILQRAKFCSRRCRELYQYRVKRGKLAEKEEKLCARCSKTFEDFVDGQNQYCSSRCRNLLRTEKVKTPLAGLNTGMKGAIGELVVCADLLSKGFEVYRAVSATSKSDLVIIPSSGQPVRVEVTTGTYRNDGSVSHTTKAAAKFDLLAVYMPADGTIHYFSNLPQLAPLNLKPFAADRSIKL